MLLHDQVDVQRTVAIEAQSLGMGFLSFLHRGMLNSIDSHQNEVSNFKVGVGVLLSLLATLRSLCRASLLDLALPPDSPSDPSH